MKCVLKFAERSTRHIRQSECFTCIVVYTVCKKINPTLLESSLLIRNYLKYRATTMDAIVFVRL